MSCFPPWEQLFFGQVTSVRSPGDDLVPRVSQSFKLSKNCPKFIQYNSYTFSFIFYFLQGQFSWIKDRELDEKSTGLLVSVASIFFSFCVLFFPHALSCGKSRPVPNKSRHRNVAKICTNFGAFRRLLLQRPCLFDFAIGKIRNTETFRL